MEFLKRIFGKTSVEPEPVSSSVVVPQPPEILIPEGPFRFIALDVETANSSPASICQIGLACVRADGSIAGLSVFVDPEEPFEGFNTSLHGIDAKTVFGSLNFPAVYAKVEILLASHTIVQHSNFDRAAFAAAREKHRIPQQEWTWLDSVQIARRAWPELRGNGGHGLANLKAVLSLEFTHHDAAEDARAAALVVLKAESVTNSDLYAMAAPKPRRTYPKAVTMDGDVNGPLAGHIAVFTGSLSISRTEAATLASRAGMTIAANVTKKTSVLIVGDQDLSLLAGHEKSTKHRKAEEMASSGHAIKIIGETEFRSMINAITPAAQVSQRAPLTKTRDWINTKASILDWDGSDIPSLMKSAHNISLLFLGDIKKGEQSYKDVALIGADIELITDTVRNFADEAELNDADTSVIQNLNDTADLLESLDEEIGNLIISKANALRR